ncbi:hypothetical protein LPLAFNJD_LOCUS1777 [Methylorubrum aminovorans]
MGFKADFVTQRELTADIIRNYDRFLFHRPAYNDHLKWAVSHIYRSGKQMCCDYDDLIFDEMAIMSSPRRKSGATPAANLFTDAIGNQRALHLFSDVVLSTHPLLDAVHNLGSFRAKVIHNGYYPGWLEHSAAAVAERRANLHAQGVKIISYFSGSASHDVDFEQLIGPLQRVMQQYSDVKLQIVGPLTLSDGCFPANRVIKKGLVPYLSLPDIKATTWMSLAPLNLHSAFNRSKSALKFFESGIFGIPCIASLSPDMLRFKDYVVPIEKQFDLPAIVERFSDPQFYKSESERIRHFSIAECSSLRQTEELHGFFGGDR